MFEKLTRRERSIVEKLAEGMNNEQIAAALDISAHTVRQHLISIFVKLKVKSRLEAVVLYYQTRERRRLAALRSYIEQLESGRAQQSLDYDEQSYSERLFK